MPVTSVSVWRDVLLLGAPSISIEDEGRSPCADPHLLDHSELRRNSGLKGFDLTIGDSEFKRRIGNQRFELQTISIFTRRRDFVAIRARTAADGIVKSAVAKAVGPDAWDDKVKEFARQAGSVAARLRHAGPVSAFRAAAAPLWERREAVLYQVNRIPFVPRRSRWK